MRKLTVSEYAKEIEKTVTAVYHRINRGEVETEKIKGKIFILVADEKKEPLKTNTNELLENDILHLKELIKIKDKEIQTLKATFEELVKSKEAEISTLKISIDTFSIIFQRQIEPKNIINDVEISKTKKKKKKRKN